MKIVKGHKTLELSEKDFEKVTALYQQIVCDLGTGDGRFVYKNALENKKTLYIGIDPIAKQMEIYSKKAMRNRLENALFVIGSIEILPVEFPSIANKLYITLPWGSLLKSITKPTKEIVAKIKRIMKIPGSLEITLGYSLEFEPSETERLNLEEIDENLIKTEILPVFLEGGFLLTKLEKLENKDLKDYETTWSKKLHFGKNRSIYRIVLSLK